MRSKIYAQESSKHTTTKLKYYLGTLNLQISDGDSGTIKAVTLMNETRRLGGQFVLVGYYI